jgi:glutamyl/glutaminyl-tRNA synthetase
MQELIEHFSLERVQKAGAIFDLDKLNWYNWQWKRTDYLNQLKSLATEIEPTVEITEPKKGHLKFNFSSPNNQQKFEAENYNILFQIISDKLSPENQKHLQTNLNKSYLILKTVEEKIIKEPENINQFISFYFEDKFNYNPELFLHEKMKIDKTTAISAIQETINQLTVEDFASEETLLEKFKTIINSLNFKNGQVLWPVRIALTNEEFSPGVFEVAFVLGHENCLIKLKSALAELS